MRKEAAGAGFYTSPWGSHPRIQLLTVGELLAGKTVDRPPENVTYLPAQRARAKAVAEELTLPFDP